MPKKKSNATKANEIPKKVDNEQKQEKNKTEPIEWKDLDKYIGQPVWDNREKKWRVLEGYKRCGFTHSITFSDIADWVSFLDRNIYLEEIKECQIMNT